MLTIWGRKSSSHVQAVMWCIGELGLPYERSDAGHIYGVNNTPEFLAMNPNGTVPVVRDGDSEPLWETGAVLRYLCGRYGAAPFWPAEGLARAHVDKWAEWSKVNVTLGFTVPIFWRTVRTAPVDQDPAAIRQAVIKLDRFLDIAEGQLSRHAFLTGGDLTMADIQFGHFLYRYFDIPIPRPNRWALQNYYEVLTSRPAFREHVMVAYDELRVSS